MSDEDETRELNEARVIVNGRVHIVRGFVYYCPECFLVLDKQGYQDERVTDPPQA